MHEIPKMRKKASKKNFSQSENTKSIKTPKRSGFGELFTPESFSRGGGRRGFKVLDKSYEKGENGVCVFDPSGSREFDDGTTR